MPIKSELARKTKIYMMDNNLTVTQVAHDIGCSRQHLSTFLHDKAQMSEELETRLRLYITRINK